VNKRLDRTTERVASPLSTRKVEKDSEVPPQSELDDRKERKRDTLQEMLFREAEIIARNLKESGTRR